MNFLSAANQEHLDLILDIKLYFNEHMDNSTNQKISFVDPQLLSTKLD